MAEPAILLNLEKRMDQDMHYLKEEIWKEQTNTVSSSFRTKKLVSFFSLVVILLALAASLFLVNLQRQFQQPGARAAGNTYVANPGDNIQSKVSMLQPGDTLIFNDGTYKSLRLDTNIGTGIHGTATAPITIKAANDGKAIFDANGTTEPIFVNGSSYVTIEGFVARNSSDSVVYLFGNNTGTLGGDDHITLRRITAYGAADGNNHVFNISFGATNVLVEDCAAWGRGRYKFIAYHADHVTFRRDWAYWEGYTSFSPAPRAPFAVYGARNVTLENVIGTNAIPTQVDNNYYTSVWVTTDDTTNWPSDNTTILGSMFYNNCEGFWENSSAGINTLLKDDYFEIPSNASCPLYSTRPYGDGMVWNYNPNSGTTTNATFITNKVGFNRFGSTGTPSIANSIFLSNGTAIVADAGHSYSDFYGNTSNGTTLTSSDEQVNPGYDTTTYGRGAYLFIPQTSPSKGAGVNGADIGANILYDYVNGQLTTTPLWPWPMEGRIMAEKGKSVTYAANGGFWKTLSGVYPNTAITSTPSPTSALTPTPTLVPDTTSPTVTITNPLNGSKVKHRTTVTITASASDNVGVSKVVFSVNNSPLCTDTTTPYTCAWTVPGKRGVVYTITAKVSDEAGNTALKSITVTST
jgi:Bacterial Ig domain/Chondroitinase B